MVGVGGDATGISKDLPRSYRLGYGLGEAAWGLAQIIVGGGGEVGGTALDATGVGALVGVPINIASAAVIVEGGADVAVGWGVFMSAWNAPAGNGGGNGGGGGGSGGGSGSGGGKPSFPNQQQATLAEEVATAERLGVKPVAPNAPNFAEVANAGKIKWAITESGELLVIPATARGTEISHAVITAGRPVIAAGEADIAVARGQAVGLSITTHSGHFLHGADAATNARVLELGREAFRRFGIIFE